MRRGKKFPPRITQALKTLAPMRYEMTSLDDPIRWAKITRSNEATSTHKKWNHIRKWINILKYQYVMSREGISISGLVCPLLMTNVKGIA
jgi:hypothetical protein